MAGNQLGKTLAGGMETAMHMTGRYPAWWKGKRFDRPVVGWICGRSDEDVRDGMQRILLGRPGEIGTGTIPKDAILDLVSARGIPGLNDLIRVQHVSGGASIGGDQVLQVRPRKLPRRDVRLCELGRRAASGNLHRGLDPDEYRQRAGVADVYAVARHVGSGATVFAGEVRRSKRHAR